MNARIDHLIDEALALAPDERSAVAIALLDSLEGEDEATIGKAWADEIRRRKNELRSGGRPRGVMGGGPCTPDRSVSEFAVVLAPGAESDITDAFV